ncbi:MAG TPA: hypothetical protein VJN18_33565 [Polyangiaceae bacterium]|nr:hypothetical protein [Polyangiaceae bacterium]
MTFNTDMAREPDAREQLDRLLAFLQRARRHWRVPALALVVGAIAFAVFLKIRSPKFRSETVILYAQRGTSESAESSGAERSVAVRLRELLFSRPRLEQVITDYDLYPEVRRKYGMGEAVEELKKHIDYRSPGGDTFSIAFEGTSANQAQRVTAELARRVLEGDSSLRKNQAQGARDFLASEKQSAESQLREAEQKLATFMAQHPRFALDATPLSNGAAIRATMGAPAPGRPATPPGWSPRSQALTTGSAGGALSPAAGMPSGPAPVLTSAEESRARAALAAAREHLAEQLTRYTPAHPDVRAAESAVQRASERLAAVAAAAGAPVAPAAPPVAAAPPTLPSAAIAAAPPRSRSIAAARAVPVAPPAAGQPENLVDLETQWLQLTRAVTETRQRQDQIEAQLFRADMQAGSEAVGHGVQVSVIDPAFLPERPQPPGKTTLGLLFAVGSLALGLLGALLLAAFDERIFRARDLAGVAEVLVEVPGMNPRRAHVAS